VGGGLGILFRHVIAVVLKIRLVEFPGQIVKEKKDTYYMNERYDRYLIDLVTASFWFGFSGQF
jgi:hypothetical protein